MVGLLDGILYSSINVAVEKRFENAKYLLLLVNNGGIIKKKEYASESARNTAFNNIKSALTSTSSNFIDFDTLLA